MMFNLIFLPWAFWIGLVKASSLKKYKEPENTTLALFLACKAVINNVFLPTAWGYSFIEFCGLYEYAELDAVNKRKIKGFSVSAINPVPW